MATKWLLPGISAGFLSDGWFWMRLIFRALSRISPDLAALALHALYRRPALTRHYNRKERALLKEASELFARAERLDTPVVTASGRGQLRAWRFQAKGPSRGLVLLLHGWSADARAMTAFVGPLVEAGYDALAVDLPAHGGSSGATACAETAACAVAAMLEVRGFSPDHVIAHSFGGAVASILAASGATPRSVVSLAAPTLMTAALVDLARFFGLSPGAVERFMDLNIRRSLRPLDDYDVQRIWRSREAEILVIHGPDDASVPWYHAEHFRDLPNARLSPAHGVSHREIVYHEGSIIAAMAHILAVDARMA